MVRYTARLIAQNTWLQPWWSRSHERVSLSIRPYRVPMPAPSALDRLLDELARGVVQPERYSTKSTYGKLEQLVLTSMLAMIAIIAGMVLGTRPGSSAR